MSICLPEHSYTFNEERCPFCGSDRVTAYNRQSFVTCLQCKARGPEVPIDSYKDREPGTRNIEAMKLWKTRAQFKGD